MKALKKLVLVLMAQLAFSNPSHAAVASISDNTEWFLRGLVVTIIGPALVHEGIHEHDPIKFVEGIACSVFCIPIGLIILDQSQPATEFQFQKLTQDQIRESQLNPEEVSSYHNELDLIDAIGSQVLLELNQARTSHTALELDQLSQKLWEQNLQWVSPLTKQALKKFLLSHPRPYAESN